MNPYIEQRIRPYEGPITITRRVTRTTKAVPNPRQDRRKRSLAAVEAIPEGTIVLIETVDTSDDYPSTSVRIEGRRSAPEYDFGSAILRDGGLETLNELEPKHLIWLAGLERHNCDNFVEYLLRQGVIRFHHIADYPLNDRGE
jgi:hypothetical protein